MTGARARPYGHLRPGRYYRLARDFADVDGRTHQEGQRWRFTHYDFLPYEDGLSLFFVAEKGETLHIRLQQRDDAQADVIDALPTILVPTAPPPRNARATLLAVGDNAISAFDGVDRATFRWTDITGISAAYGRQQYDCTRCLEIDHTRGTTIFLPEVEDLWPMFNAGISAHLPGAIDEKTWTLRLGDQPDATIEVWRPGLLRRMFRP